MENGSPTPDNGPRGGWTDGKWSMMWNMQRWDKLDEVIWNFFNELPLVLDI